MSAPYDLAGHIVVVDTSIGIALAPSDGVEPDGLLKAADMALYVDNGEYFRFDDKVKVVTMSGPDVQPNDCATRFDTARLPAGAQINVRNDDVTLCINTSFSEAQRQGIKWKIVVLHVTGVSADGTVNVSLKAWNVPE